MEICVSLMIVALFFLVTSSTVNAVQGPKTSEVRCFLCTTFLNREWRPNLSGNCTGTKSDCGKCFVGYFAEGNDERCTLQRVDGMYINLHPNITQAYASYNDKLILRCIFDQPVDCEWTRGDYHLDVTGRYRYLNSKNGKGANDCSIEISRFQAIDVKLWTCEANVYSSSEAIRSMAVQLMRVDVKYPTIVTGPKNASAIIGKDTGLSCTFDDDVPCTWFLNGTEIEIKDSLEFVSQHTGHNSKNCSIVIKSFKQDDAGNWTCTYKGSLKTDSTSNSAWLSVSPMRAPTRPEMSIGNTTIKRNEITNLLDNTTITCTSRFGNPAPKLRWEMKNANFSYEEEKVTVDGELVNVEIMLNVTLNKLQFKPGLNMLKCVVTHPLLDGTKYEEWMITYAQNVKEVPTDYGIAIALGITFLVIVLIALLFFGYFWRVDIVERIRRWKRNGELNQPDEERSNDETLVPLNNNESNQPKVSKEAMMNNEEGFF